jgi:high-affinity iron transporter
MLEALIVTLREGVEAALVVGIIAAFLRREADGRHLGAVWAGIVAALAASFAGGLALRHVAVDEDVLEGFLYLIAAAVVGSMLVWMVRHSRGLAGEMKGRLATILRRERASSVTAGIFLFTFLMVFREGMETVLFLSALSLTSGGLQTLLGVIVGLGAATVFGVLFVRGSLRVDLGRFFKITGIALGIFIVQLVVDGYHELAEAGWLPANQTTMATIGPLAKNEFFFIAAVLALPLLMLLVPGRPPAASAAAATAAGAAGRLERAAAERQGRARVLAGGLGVVILAALGLGFVYSRPPAALSASEALAPGADGTVRIPVAGFHGTALRRFTVTLPAAPAAGPGAAAAAGASAGAAAGAGAGTTAGAGAGGTVRFIAVPLADPGQPGTVIATAFDACEICGAKGYYQEGGNIACLHCGSTIYPPSIGQHGGCNPIPLASRREGGDLVLTVADLAAGLPHFGAAAAAHHPGM